MYRNKLLLQFLSVILLLALATLSDSAQLYPGGKVHVVKEIEPKFRQALQSYRAGDYQQAFTRFRELSQANLIHQRMTASLLMAGKSLYHLGQYSEALSFLDRLIQTFPMSQYVDDAYYARAQCEYRLKQYLQALKNLLLILENSPNKPLVDKSIHFARFLMRKEFSLSQLRKIPSLAKGENSLALITIELARKEYLQGSPSRAVSLLNKFKNKYPNSSWISQIDQLENDLKKYKKRPVRIGVLLPVTGLYAEEGKGILRGIKFAQMASKNNSSAPILLKFQDSQSNMIKAVKAVKYFASEGGVSAIIGELESQITAGVGALASIFNIPLLAPAATENELTSVGDLVFQLNSDLERKGAAIAEYAINQLGLRTFATLAPADDYGLEITASFTSKIDELGGRIIAQSWYYGETQDFAAQFKAIREAAFHYDSTDVEHILKIAEEQGKDMDELDIPVESIDAIFLPIYTEDIKYVAPQLALYNIRAQILGGEYWDNLEVLKRAQIARYVNGVIFVSDYFPDENNRTFRNFRTEFRIKMGKTPERWEVFGYDAFQVLHKVISEGATTPEEIAKKLNSLENFHGLKGKITLKGSDRVNREVNFLQFINDRIIKLEE